MKSFWPSSKNVLDSGQLSPSGWGFGFRRWPCCRSKNILNAYLLGTHCGKQLQYGCRFNLFIMNETWECVLFIGL